MKYFATVALLLIVAIGCASGQSSAEDAQNDRWALVSISVASMRSEHAHASEMETQALMGTPLRVLKEDGSWYYVECPDGYTAWIPSTSLEIKSAAELDAWRDSKRYIVTSPYEVRTYRSANAKTPRDVVCDLVGGCIISIPEREAMPEKEAMPENGRLEVVLPDGRTAFVDSVALQPIEEWAAQDFDANLILDTAYSLLGVPYLWGGTSSKAMDCSGLSKLCYFANGIILLRNASQQAVSGMHINAEDWRDYIAGDLVFFDNDKGKVVHVAIYDRDGMVVHASGSVVCNSLDPNASSYIARHLHHAVRIQGMEDTPGIIRARNHAWYFNN